MNQEILIVFTLFLLITILLLLLGADAKEKSRLIRILVTVSANTEDHDLMDAIRSFFDKITDGDQLHFTVTGEDQSPENAPSVAYRLMIQVQIHPVDGEGTEVYTDPLNYNVIHLVAGASNFRNDNPHFSDQVQQAIRRKTENGEQRV